MHTVLVVIVLFLSLIFCLPIHLYLRAVSKKDQTRGWIKSHKLVRWFFNTELRCAGCKVIVKGEENIPEETALYVGNHRSYLDILIHHKILNRPVGFVAKKEMEKFPLLPLYMKDIGCLFLDRNDIKQGMETIKTGTSYLEAGHSMVLFPEGTRNHNETMLPFKEGGYKMAERAKCPIVPVAIIGSDKLLETSGTKGVKKGTVTVVYGKPFTPSDVPPKERKELYAKLPEIIQTMINENK